MADRTPIPALPRRDADGRVVRLTEFAGVVLMFWVVNLVGLVLIDGLVSLLGAEFGRSTGWLTLILPGLLFFDDLRGWRGRGLRFLVAIVAAAAAVGLGLIAAGSLPDLWPLVSGSLGALVAIVVYLPVWFLGIRWLTGDSPHLESP
jgi:hypothetical protein